jgi:hypothetical protein
MNEGNVRMMFVANREVRWIPKGWKHPKGADGRYAPLLPNGYAAQNSLTEEDLNGVGEMPATTGPARLNGLEIAAYETTTEGTPISPAFPDTPEGRLALVNYCAEHATTWGDHRADAETWAAILFGDGAMVGTDGSVRF